MRVAIFESVITRNLRMRIYNPTGTGSFSSVNLPKTWRCQARIKLEWDPDAFEC